jgi:hypothetical protein
MRFRPTLARLLVIAAFGGFVAASCAAPKDAASQQSGASIDAYGIRMGFPDGWDARISFRESTPGPVVEAATFPLPAAAQDSMYLATHSSDPQDVILAIHDETRACPCDGFAETSTPFSIRPEDFTSWQGLEETHSLATRSVVINGRSLQVWVNFGSTPAPDARLDEVNRILGSMSLDRSPGDASRPPPNTWTPPTFELAPGWNATSTGPVPVGSEGLGESWAVNVPFAAEDLRESALVGQLVAWPGATMKALPPDGVVMATWLDFSDEVPASPSREFPARGLPLQIADAEVQHDWEGRVTPNVPFYWIRATAKSQSVEVRIFFGTQNPSPDTLHAAQDELNRLVIPDLASPPPPTARVAATIPVGPHPSAVAVGQGSVWVAVRGERHEDNAVVRIDPDTGEVVARIPVDVVPGWEVGGGGLAVSDQSVWVAGAMGDGPGLIERIDTATNKVVDAIHVDGYPADVATFASGYVWVLLRGDPDTPRLLEIAVSPDPMQSSTHDIVSETQLPGAYGRRLINAGGQMLAMVAAPGDGSVDDSLLYRLDSWTGRVEGVLDLDAYAPIAGSVTQVWAATGDALVRIDPETGRPLGDPLPASNTGDALAIGEGGVWFFDPAKDRAVSRLNPVTGRVDVSVDGTAGIDLAAYLGSVWVMNSQDSITRIELT